MTKLRVLSLFAGVGGFDIGFHAAGWETALACEIDPHARAVFRHNFPGVHIAPDIKRLRAKELNQYGPFDVVCGGFPCQDLSVAGKRAGLAGKRSGLFFRIMRLIPKLRPLPRWIVLENVPGLMSADERRAMGTVTAAMGQRGYVGGARCLDLQFFRVPQRRRRVFIVGNLGNWRRAAEVLFDGESVPGNPPPRRSSGKEVAALTSRGVGTCGADDNQAQAGHLIPTHDVAPCLQERGGKGVDSDCTQALVQCVTGTVAHTLKAEGADASEDGTGRGTPIIFDTTQITSSANFSAPKPGDPSHPLAAGMHAPCLAFKPGQSEAAGGVFVTEEYAPTLQAQNNGSTCTPAVCFNARQDPDVSGDVSQSLGAKDTGHAIAFCERGRDQGRTLEVQEELAYCVTNPASGGRTHSRQILDPAMQVRRLMPIECERLMNWPDDFTRWGITDQGELIEMSDSARYRLCGNGVGRKHSLWLAERINAVEAA